MKLFFKINLQWLRQKIFSNLFQSSPSRIKPSNEAFFFLCNERRWVLLGFPALLFEPFTSRLCVNCWIILQCRSVAFGLLQNNMPALDERIPTQPIPLQQSIYEAVLRAITWQKILLTQQCNAVESAASWWMLLVRKNVERGTMEYWQFGIKLFAWQCNNITE